jgi:hypothetical protein
MPADMDDMMPRLKAMACSYGNHAILCDFVPRHDVVDLEPWQGPGRILGFQFETLSIKLEGPVCNFYVVQGHIVSSRLTH